MDLAEVYARFPEEERLNRGNSSRVEFLTTTHFIDAYLTPGSKILEIGAATGAYSLHYAAQGHRVTALEPVERNLEILMERVRPCMDIKPLLGNGLDLSALPENYFDMVLCLGPLYHLAQKQERQQVIAQAKRVCRPGGVLFFAYLSNDMVFITEAVLYQKDPLRGKNYNQQYELTPLPFTFMTPPQALGLVTDQGLTPLTHFAADGLAELLQGTMDAWDAQQFAQWMGYHLHTCQKPELLGHSNHIVLVAQKPQ